MILQVLVNGVCSPQRKGLIHGFPLGELTMVINHLQVLGSSKYWVFMSLSQGTDGRMEVESPGSQADYYLDLRKATVVTKINTNIPPNGGEKW